MGRDLPNAAGLGSVMLNGRIGDANLRIGQQSAIKRHLILRSAWLEAAIRKDAAMRCMSDRLFCRTAAVRQRGTPARGRPEYSLLEASRIDLTLTWY
jgi:hypothetical protein